MDSKDYIVMFRTQKHFEVDIKKGDAVCLVGPFTISNKGYTYKKVLGEAREDCTENNVEIPVLVRGIGRFRADKRSYISKGEYIHLNYGVSMSSTPGQVRIKRCDSCTTGMVLDFKNGTAIVLL